MLSPILHPASGFWMLGRIEEHTAKPLTRAEIEAHIKERNHLLKIAETPLFTETDCLRFIREAAAKTGLDGIELAVTTRDYKAFTAHYNHHCGIGDTIEAAVGDVSRFIVTPEQRVKDLEEQLAAARAMVGTQRKVA